MNYGEISIIASRIERSCRQDLLADTADVNELLLNEASQSKAARISDILV